MRLNLSKRFPEALILIAALAVAGCAAKPLPAGDRQWPTYHGDFARTNLSSGQMDLPLVVGWTKDLSDRRFFNPFPDEQLSSPVISGGRLYAASSNSRLYATDLASGRVAWKFDAGYPIDAPPTVAGDMVCFGTTAGVMRCLDLDGKPLWQFQARSEILSSPVVRDGRLYFSSSDDRLYALDSRTGERLWTYSRTSFKTVTPRVYASPALSEGGRLFYLFSDGTMACLSAEGKELWTKKVVKEFDETVPPRRTPLVDSGTVHVIDGNGAVIAMSEATGEVKGIYNTIRATDFVLPEAGSIVVAGEGEVMAIDRSTGATLWRTGLERGPVSSVFAGGGWLFVLSNFKKAPLGIKYFAKDKGYIEAISLSDGKKAWGRAFGSSLSADASTALERVALITNDGRLSVFEPKQAR